MLLIDSIYINRGGGLILLQYLVGSLIEKDIEFHLLLDRRCAEQFDFIENKTILSPSLMLRHKFYKANKGKWNKVFCFGNLPPSIRLEVPVYTYFHNINLLRIFGCKNIISFIKSHIKRCVLKVLKNNTSKWIVQTSNTKLELIKNLSEMENRVELLPFYLLDLTGCSDEGDILRTDYVYIGSYNHGFKNHHNLIEAWRLLCEQGFSANLHLTISMQDKHCIRLISNAQQRGAKIINHGELSHREVMQLLSSCKAIVYPSFNESLGLGIVEAIYAGCDVISSNLPFAHSICEPSITFNPKSPQSIADAVLKYNKGTCPKSILKISNKIDQVISLLSGNF